MALLQALLALITKSAGKILNAVFGWAVHALFGRTSARDQTMLSAVVGAAIAWPLLVAGIVAPKVAALVLTFVPLPHAVPSWIVRLVWLTLALAVPIVLGLTLGARRPAQAPPESYAKRVLRGFPMTLGLALAFFMMFISVPLMRLASLARREKSADVPLVTDVAAYHEVAGRVVEALNRHGFALRATEPHWWVKAPTRLLAWFGGETVAAFVPTRIEHHVAPGLEVSFYTSGVLLRGKGARLTWAHGLIAETAVHGRGLQTLSPPAQEVEQHIRRLWRTFDGAPAEHAGSAALLARLGELARELTRLDVDYDEWQVLYRQLLQVERAVRGERQLLDDVSGVSKEGVMKANTANDDDKKTGEWHTGGAEPEASAPSGTHAHAAPEALSTPELLAEIARQVPALVKAQLELAKSELRENVASEVKMAAGFGVAAVAGLLAGSGLLVTAILALSAVMPAWAAGLAVTGATLVVAGIAAAFGRSHRVEHPLARTRHELEEDVQWTKEKVA